MDLLRLSHSETEMNAKKVDSHTDKMKTDVGDWFYGRDMEISSE
jgi:hypothetical protein